MPGLQCKKTVPWLKVCERLKDAQRLIIYAFIPF